MKALRVLVVPLVLVAASCGGGDDDGSDGGDVATDDVEAFCERLRVLDADESVDVDEDFDAAMSEMEALRDAAPSRIRDDIDTVIDVFRRMGELEATDPDDEDAFAAVFELLLDPDFTEATERLEQFGVDECGLEPSDDGTDPDVDIDVDGEFDIDTGSEGTDDVARKDAAADDATSGLVTEAADVPDPLFDPVFEDDVVDPTELSINGLQYHLDVHHPDAPWRPRLMSFGIGGGVTVGGTELDEVATEVCDAVAEYVVAFEPDWEITIESYAQDEGGTYDYVGELITGSAGNGC